MLTQWRRWVHRRPRLTWLAVWYAVVIGILGPLATDGSGGGRLEWVFWAIVPVGWLVIVMAWVTVASPVLVVFPSLVHPPAYFEWTFGLLVWGAAGATQAAFLIVVWDGVRAGFGQCRARCRAARAAVG